MDLSDDSEYDYDSDDEATSHVAESAPVPQWSQQQQEDEPADQEGWQAVGVKGKAAPPAVSPQAGAASSSRVQEPGEDPAELQRREEELLRAAIQVGAACDFNPLGVLWASLHHIWCVCLGWSVGAWLSGTCCVPVRGCCWSICAMQQCCGVATAELKRLEEELLVTECHLCFEFALTQNWGCFLAA